MRLVDLLPQEHIVAPLGAGTVREAVRELFDRLVERGAVTEPVIAESALFGDAAAEIVAIAPQVVLPHLRTPAVDRLVLALGVTARPLTEAGGAASDVRVAALVLAPENAVSLYLQAVAALATVLSRDTVVDRLAAARSAEAVLAVPQLSSVRLESKLTVGDIMIRAPDSIAPERSVRDAVDVMLRQRVRALPVVGAKGEVLGIISEWDVMRALLPQIPRDTASESAETAQPLAVREVMTRSVLCVAEELGVEEAARMMINKDVEQFPVTNDGKLTGFLTRGDIIRKLFGHGMP